MTPYEALSRLYMASDNGAVVGACIDYCRSLGLPDPDRGTLAGQVKRFPERRKLAHAIEAALHEHVRRRQTGGIQGVAPFIARCLAGAKDEAPAPEWSDAQRDAVAALVSMQYGKREAEGLVAQAKGDDWESLVRDVLSGKGE